MPKKLDITARKINAVTRKVAGKRLAELAADYILDKARQLLLETDLRIKEITYELGFPMPSAFNHFFKDHMGFTPLNFRRKGKLPQ